MTHSEDTKSEYVENWPLPPCPHQSIQILWVHERLPDVDMLRAQKELSLAVCWFGGREINLNYSEMLMWIQGLKTRGKRTRGGARAIAELTTGSWLCGSCPGRCKNYLSQGQKWPLMTTGEGIEANCPLGPAEGTSSSWQYSNQRT